MQRVATGHGIDTDGLIKSQDQLDQEQEAQEQAQMQAQMQDTIAKAAPGVANTVTGEVMKQQGEE